MTSVLADSNHRRTVTVQIVDYGTGWFIFSGLGAIDLVDPANSLLFDLSIEDLQVIVVLLDQNSSAVLNCGRH